MTALFTSTHSALAFAFNYSERQGMPNLLQRLADKDREPGKGLTGLDGAGQAGMIKREVSELPTLQRAVIVAKFARPKPCPHCQSLVDASERKEAIEALAQHVQGVLVGDLPNLVLRRQLVRKHFGDRIGMAELAKKCGVHQNTASNHGRKVKRVLAQLEREALQALDECLKSVVGSPEDIEDQPGPV